MPIQAGAKPPAVWQSPKNIQYLSFQGGGGKGITYLGALDWLEQHNAPIPLIKPQGGTGPLTLIRGIKGIAGASAGAMTALLVSLGFSAGQLKAILGQVTVPDLIDEPEYGRVRWVSPKGNTLDLASPYDATLAQGIGTVLSGSGLGLVAALAGPSPQTSLLGKFASDARYWACLVGDGGFVSGIQLRTWLGQQIANSPLMAMAMAQASPAARSQIPQDGTKLTFRQHYQMLGSQVQLAVVGTNLATSRPVVFAPTSTPDFPVADAVAISASFPGVFKPAWVGFDAPLGYAPASRNLNVMSNFVGWYADGGMINNIPLHMFDQKVVSIDPYLSPVPGAPGGLPPLNENMLCLRLQEGDPPSPIQSLLRDPPPATPGLGQTGGQVFDALNFQSNAGQIRSPAEGNQTVILYTNGIGLLDFIAPPSAMQQAWSNASDEVNTYYTVPPR